MTPTRTFVLLLVALMGVPSHCSQNHYNPIRSELKYIACEVCEETAAALHGHVEELRKTKGKKLTEEAVNKVVENICQPDPGEVGDWILELDVIQRDGALKLRKQKEQGACRKECKTIATSCQDLLDNLDEIDELVVSLWKGENKSQIKDSLCSTVCSKKVPKFTGKRSNEKFVTKEEALAEQLAQMKKKQAREQQTRSTQSKAASVEPSLLEGLSAAVRGMSKDALSLIDENGSWMWKEIQKYMTQKQIQKYGKQLFQDMKRDLYDKTTMKRTKRQLNWLWDIHQPAALWKDSSMRTTLHIMGLLLGSVSVLEVTALGLSRVVSQWHSSGASSGIVGTSVIFFVTCAVGLYFKL